MPLRKHPFLNKSIYHVFNKTIEKKKIFASSNTCREFLEITDYYRPSEVRIRYSKFKKLSDEFKAEYIKHIQNQNMYYTQILAYCLMPTHYHLLLQQEQEKGVMTFISKIQNSFTRDYNIKNNRTGPLFVNRFKSVPVTSEEQLKHVSRYIHLNPFSSNIVTDIFKLPEYSWSSYPVYILSKESTFVSECIVLSLFNNDKNRYKKFVIDNAEYQRTLEYCKHTERW